MLNVGDYIREYCRQQGISLPAFARRAGVSDSTLRLLLRYGILPQWVDTRLRLAQALGVGYDELWNDQPTEGGEA